MERVTNPEHELKLCLDGDTEALARLYSRHHRRLLATAVRVVGDTEAARDVEHDAWVVILTSLHTVHNAGKLDAWLDTVVRNTALNYAKHTRVTRAVPLDDATLATGQPVADDDTPLAVPLPSLMSLVERLPQGYEQVFRLSIFEGLSHGEIAHLLGISEGTSRSQLSRAKVLLRKLATPYLAVLVLAVSVSVLIHYLSEPAHEAGKPVSSHTDAEAVIEAPVNEPPHPLPVPPHSQMATGSATVAENRPDTVPHDTPRDVPHALRAHFAPRHAADTSMLPPLMLDSKQAQSPSMPPPPSPHPTRRGPWNMHLAYGASPMAGSTATNNFMHVIDFASANMARTVTLRTWGDFVEYVDSNARYMSPGEAAIMRQMAHSVAGDNTADNNHTDDYRRVPISETVRHDRPITYRLWLNVPLAQRWSLATGLAYTSMKSTFENSTDNETMQRVQRLKYLGMPLQASYTLWQRGRWQAYATGGMQLDVPLRCTDDTRYIYIGSYEHAQGDSLVFPSAHSTIAAPLQWSVSGGAGLQYRLLPHVNVYFEPGFRYYIPAGGAVESYNTRHRFQVSLPVGIRFTP